MRNRNYDIIRVIAIAMVICIHSMAPLRDAATDSPLLYGLYVLYDVIISTGVPMFFMLSGALLLGREESVREFYIRRLPRILVPLFLWSILVYLISCLMKGGGSLQEFVAQFITGQINEAYWFAYSILGLYMITPFIRYLLRQSRNVRYMATALLLIAFVLLFIARQSVTCMKYPHRFVTFILYYVAGYYLTTNSCKHQRLIAIAATVVGSIGYFLTLYFRWFALPWTILSSMGLFVLLCHLPHQKLAGHKEIDTIAFLSQNCYGIYLSHVILCGALVRVISGFSWLPVAIIPLLVVAIVLPLEYFLMRLITRVHLNRWLC